MTEKSPNHVTPDNDENSPDVDSGDTDTKPDPEISESESDYSNDDLNDSVDSSDESVNSSDDYDESLYDSDEDRENDRFNLKIGLKNQPGVQCTVVAEVLERSKKRECITKEGKVEEYFILYVADHDVCATIRAYRNSDSCKFPSIHRGEVYKFQTLTRLDESKRNESFLAPYNIKIKETDLDTYVRGRVRKACKQIMYKPLWNSTRRRALNDAFYSEDESTITGKIVKVSPLIKIFSFDDDDEIDMIHLAIIDEPDMEPLKITLYHNNARKPYKAGSSIIVSNVCLNQLKSGSQIPGLSSRRITKGETMTKVKITDEDHSEPMRTLTTNIQVDDPDFDEQIFIIKEVTEVMRRCERALEGGVRCTGYVKVTKGRFWCEKCLTGRRLNEHVLMASIGVKSANCDLGLLILRKEDINKVIGYDIRNDDENAIMRQLERKLPRKVKGCIIDKRGMDVLKVTDIITGNINIAK